MGRRAEVKLENKIYMQFCMYTNISTRTAQILHAPDETSNL